jgi:sec-independent protein translocase protein TatA
MPFPSIGPLELIIILVIALLILGPGRLPEVGSSLGKSIREFRKAASDAQDATKIDVSPNPAPAAPATTASTPAPAAAPPSSANVLTEQAKPNEIASEPKA